MSTAPCDNAGPGPFISVLVPHYDQKLLLRQCLASLEAQTLNRSDYEIIVADNGTPDGVGDLAHDFPDVKFLSVTERGAACARNAAMDAARGDIFAFIDADCVAHADWLASGVAALARGDMVGGEVETTSANSDRMTAVEAFELVFAFRQRRYVARDQFSVTANLFARRDVASRIGTFRNGVAEDVDWCRRGAALGFHLVFDPKPIVKHPARRDWRELTAKWERLIRERWNGMAGRRRWRGPVWVVLAVATALSAAPHAVQVVLSPRLRRGRDKLGALTVLARIRLWRAQRMLALLTPRSALAVAR